MWGHGPYFLLCNNFFHFSSLKYREYGIGMCGLVSQNNLALCQQMTMVD